MPGNRPLKFATVSSDKPAVDDLTREFLLESEEGLDRMERGLTELELRPTDSGLLAEIFRSVHTLKGTTGFLGFPRLEALAHAGENLLGLLRDGRLAANPDVISGLLALLDRLRGILGSIETSGGEGEAGLEDRVMVARLEALQRNEAGRGPWEDSATAVAAAARPANLQAGGSPAPSTPRRRQSGSRHAVVSHPVSPRRRMPTSGEAGPPKNEPGLPPEAPAPASVSVAGNQAPFSRPRAPSAEGASSASADSTLRVDIELLNRIMNLVGELVLTRNQILQATSAGAAFAPLGRRLDMVTADLREAVMKARMQPVSHVFSRFPRMVRDLARSLGKPVRLEMEGAETELDKSLLEAIRDPLTHAIRNAVDHGIEGAAARAAAGKPAEGVVRLCARHEGSHVIVEVQDDGAGMNIERIRDKAVDRGFVSAARIAQLSEREVLQLVFVPGFSTADAITSVSGRGVGMDVVRTNVERIGGKVEIDSRSGGGTTLRLRIPLTLAIIPALIVRSRGLHFAIPQSALTELVHLSAAEAATRVEWLENAALYRLRGRLLPLLFLDDLLRQPPCERKGCDIAVLNADGRHFGLVVDGVADPEEIVVKPLAPVLREIGFYSGATVLANGDMALILHPGAIAQSAGIRLTEETEEPEHEPATRHDAGQFLLVETRMRQAALPLEAVVRIERIPRSRIERAGSRAVLRFNEELVPLDAAADDPGEADALTTVVVCREGARQVGLVVSRVLDVATGSSLREAGTSAAPADLVLLRDRVTGVVPLSAIPALARTEAQL